MLNFIEQGLYFIRNVYVEVLQKLPEIFLKTVNLSITACWLILAVLVLRRTLKKAPKWIHCCLWGLVGIRLIFPFSIESMFSLVPSAETFRTELTYSSTIEVNTGFGSVDRRVNDYLDNYSLDIVMTSSGLQFDARIIFVIIWLAGIVMMLGYAVYSYVKLKQDLKTTTPLCISNLTGDKKNACEALQQVTKKNNSSIKICQSEKAGSPFVLGILKPTIYLPYNLNPKDIQYVIAHEKAHIKRKDHWIKPLAYLILAVHWFNPLLWVAYALLCKDIELACDEKVIASLDMEKRQDYSLALLNCRIRRYSISACPLAFGEVSVKERVKSVMSYKKPAFWIAAVGVIACVAAAVCFLTNPQDELVDEPELLAHASYRVIEDTYYLPLISSRYIVGGTTPYYMISNDYAFYESKKDTCNWEQIYGSFQEIRLAKDNFDVYFSMMGGSTVGKEELAEKLRKENSKAWRFDIQKDAEDAKNVDKFYYFLLQKNGDVYLAQGCTEKEEYFYEGTVENGWFYWVFKLEALDYVWVNILTENMNYMWLPAWYPDGEFAADFNYDSLFTAEVKDSCVIEMQLDHEVDVLRVSEHYYEQTDQGTDIHKATYNLEPIRNGGWQEFQLEVTHRNVGQDERAIYYVETENGQCVFQIILPAQALE